MKDPAFLFYSGDFLTGVVDLTMEERGQYITLLCLQHQKGRLSKKVISLTVTGVSKDVISKFDVDDNGLYFNARLENEVIKRAKHSERQKENINKRWNKNTDYIPTTIPTTIPKTYQTDTKNIPLENENENINEDVIVVESECENGRSQNITEIIAYLNMTAGTNYRASSKATQRHIGARLNEGFVLDDFKRVISKKYDEWKDSKMAAYLRPETLFGNKFESYLNQPDVKPKSSNQFLAMVREDEENDA